MTAKGPYSRLYHSIVDDPMFERVYRSDAAFATWCRMLMAADATYPASAPIPRSNSAVRLLIEVGLVLEKPGKRYMIRGLAAERERRSASSRIGAEVRWQSERNANAMPRREETRQDKKSSGANAPKKDDPPPLSEEERDRLLQENLRLMNDPKIPGAVRRAAEHTVALLREGRKSA